jgi:uncharacterized protein YraI
VHPKAIVLFILALILCTACGVNITSENTIATPEFVTATLAGTFTPAPSPTAIPTSPLPTVPPVEGTTTTQLNVRTEPSTAGVSLGVITAFSKVQILGRESNGAWYQIVYPSGPDGKGWVTATYVQVDADLVIPVVSVGTDTGLSRSGLVTGPLNVRSGPGTTYESLGTLSVNDVVAVVGRDSSGSWMQIEFKGAAGWAAAEFMKVDGADALPVTAQATSSTLAGQSTTAPQQTPAVLPAVDDHDSKQEPAASMVFSPAGARTFQFNGNVSAPLGDREDWLQFTSFSTSLLLEVKCSNEGLGIELWDEAQFLGNTYACQDVKRLQITAGQTYFLHITAHESAGSLVTRYDLKLGIIR